MFLCVSTLKEKSNRTVRPRCTATKFLFKKSSKVAASLNLRNSLVHRAKFRSKDLVGSRVMMKQKKRFFVRATKFAEKIGCKVMAGEEENPPIAKCTAEQS